MLTEPTTTTAMQHASTIAAHRFGLSETGLAVLRDDPRGWVLAQLRAPQALDGSGLKTSYETLAMGRQVLRAALRAPSANAQAAVPPMAGNNADRMAGVGDPVAAMPSVERPYAGLPAARRNDAAAAGNAERRQLVAAGSSELQRRWQHMVTTPTPVAERWVQFWSNHFCVASTKGTMLGMVWPFEREAIRPYAFGRFADLLRAATLHPSMLLYLDNAQSIGPNSQAGQRRDRGLNENLARELLELHTLGVHGGYTQADVTEGARLLTGWTVPRDPNGNAAGGLGARLAAAQIPSTDDAAAGRGIFVAALHEPGAKRVLGKSYADGPQAAEQWLADLARHPSTATHVSTKLVRHFVTDDPPAVLVDAVAARFRATDGDLLAVAQALFGHDLAWRGDLPPKFKRPEELLLSAHRVLKLPVQSQAQAARLGFAMAEMCQPPGRAPSPQGWPDRQEDWLAPDALWKRVEWASQFAQTAGTLADARTLADASFGADLGAETGRQIERAESAAQAMALLLASPEFLRR